MLHTYGRSSGFCIDPIEKKPLAHVLPGSATFSFGTAGCNLACRFCQNWDISSRSRTTPWPTTRRPRPSPPPRSNAGAGACRSPTTTPPSSWRCAIDVADACHDVGLRTVAVTAGYIEPQPRADLYAHLDAANVDLKGFTEDFYRHTCGAELGGARHPAVPAPRDRRGSKLTTLLIPGANDGDAELDAMTAWVVEHLGPDVPMHFTAFHPDYRMLDTPPTPPATLARARRHALANGVRFAYTGNVHDPAGQSTSCPTCGEVVISRDGYRLGRYRLDDLGRCRSCATPLPGLFDGAAGTWGPRRVPVAMHQPPSEQP
ncbi:MAG: AmmeMemoRadiSam system radical SAM enzyme [Acidimicrobiales bacterium]